MSEAFLKTQIISPDNEIYDGNADMVVLPGEDGDFAAMYEHAPIITFLRPGKVEVFSKEEKEKIAFFVAGGFVKIQNNNCLVMVDYIRKNSEIDVKENEKKISELLFKLEKTENQTVRDNLIMDIDLIRSENQASEQS
jgi:F-type H+-transporting ATPase subunit epsilon